MIGRSTITGRPLEPVASIQSRLEILPGQPYQLGELRTRLADYVTSMRRRHYYEAAAAVLPNSVLIRPGWMITTPTPNCLTSKRSASLSASTAYFVAW